MEENKNKWTLVDILSIIAFVIMVGIVCYQNHRISIQDGHLTVQQEQIQQLSDALNKSVNAQNDIIEIQKEQTAAIMVLNEKLDNKMDKRRK